MSVSTLPTIGVVGAGTMGNGIAHVAARAGFEVVLYDLEPARLERALATISRNLEREAAKGLLPPGGVAEARDRIHPSTMPGTLARAEFLIEAVPEDFTLKAGVFTLMDEHAAPEAVLASNTSSISITRLGAGVRRPERVIGMHFMNPVPVLPLVEIVRGMATSDGTAEATRRLTERLGKTAVEVADSPGFVSNRILMPMINEAVYCLMEGVAPAEAIDAVMKLGMNHPLGPLALADLIGLDVCLQILNVLQAEIGDPKYRPCPLLRRMVHAGHLGRKTGRGFYVYAAT